MALLFAVNHLKHSFNLFKWSSSIVFLWKLAAFYHKFSIKFLYAIILKEFDFCLRSHLSQAYELFKQKTQGRKQCLLYAKQINKGPGQRTKLILRDIVTSSLSKIHIICFHFFSLIYETYKK